MWIVLKLISKDNFNRFESVMPNASSVVTVLLFGKHMGYMPVYISYESAYKDFPMETIHKLRDT